MSVNHQAAQLFNFLIINLYKFFLSAYTLLWARQNEG